MTISPSRTEFGATTRRKRERKTLLAVLRGQNGAIDLASIMVGVLVIGIIGGVIAATVFAVVPWSQDEAAKGDLSAVKTAEAVFTVSHQGYGSLDELRAPTSFAVGGGAPRQPAASVSATGKALLSAGGNISISNNVAGYVVASTSATGHVFWLTSLSSTVTTAVPTVLPAGLTAPTPVAIAGAAAATSWDAAAAASELHGYLVAAGEYYKTTAGGLPASPAAIGYMVPAGLHIYNADNLANGQGLMSSGEGMHAIVTDGTNSLYAGVSMVFPASTNWSAPDYSTVTYTIDVPVSALDTTAMTNLVGYGYITAPEIQYRTFNTLTALGIADPNGAGACTASGTIDVTCP
jgi:hypothetical protein